MPPFGCLEPDWRVLPRFNEKKQNALSPPIKVVRNRYMAIKFGGFDDDILRGVSVGRGAVLGEKLGSRFRNRIPRAT